MCRGVALSVKPSLYRVHVRTAVYVQPTTVILPVGCVFSFAFRLAC